MQSFGFTRKFFAPNRIRMLKSLSIEIDYAENGISSAE